MNRLVGLVALLLVVFGVSGAYAISWEDYTGPVTIKFSGYTNGTTYSPTAQPVFDDIEDGWGVGRVSTVVPGFTGSGSTPLWTYDANSTEEITYYYHDIVDYAFGAQPGQILSKGGVFDFYVNPAGTAEFLASNRNLDGFDFKTITGGTKLGRVLLVPGIITGDGVTTIQQSLFPYSGGGVIGNGTALAAVDLTGDWNTAWARALDSNAFNGADLTLGFTVKPNTENNGFSLVHNDPAKAIVTPEPLSATLFLFGGVSLLAKLRRKTGIK